MEASYHSPKNPTYLARKAWNVMSSGNYEGSFGYYRKAIALDDVYSFIPAYNYGYALVRANSRSKSYDDRVPGEVSTYLGRAFYNINKVHIPQTLKLREILKPEENSPLALQIEAKLDLLAYQKAYIEPAIATSRGISGGHHIIVAGYKQIREVFPAQGNSADPIYEAAISEVNAAGLHLFYDLGAKPPPPRGDAALGMIVSIGAAAIAAPYIGPGAFAWAGSFGSAALGSAAVGVTSRFAGGIVTNRGRIDKAFQDVTSKDSLKSLALDSISAGACAGLEKHFKIAGLKGADDKTLRGAQMHVRIAQQHAIRGVVHSAVRQENLVKSLEREGGNAALASANFQLAEALPGKGFANHLTKIGGRYVINSVYAKANNIDSRAALAATLAPSIVPGEAAPVGAAILAMALTHGDERAQLKAMAAANRMAGITVAYNDKLHETGDDAIAQAEDDERQEERKYKRTLSELSRRINADSNLRNLSPRDYALLEKAFVEVSTQHPNVNGGNAAKLIFDSFRATREGVEDVWLESAIPVGKAVGGLIKTGVSIFRAAENVPNPQNVALFERFKQDLKAQERFISSNTELNNLSKWVSRKPHINSIGDGSTAAAVRHELRTGIPVGGKIVLYGEYIVGGFHFQKARDASTALRTWLRKNPTACPDKTIAEHTLQDLQNALKGAKK